MGPDKIDHLTIAELQEQLRLANAENQMLVEKNHEANAYIREKVDQLLKVIGTIPLQPDELDDDTLIHLDPIGIISNTFIQILEHLRQTNLDLETAKKDIQAIFESVGEAIQVLNARGEIIAYNKKMTGLFVIQEQDVIGRTCREAVCADETNEEDCLFRMVLERRKSVRVRSWVCRNRYYEIIGTPVFDKQGILQRVVILYMDTTRRRRSEMALLESEDRFRDLFENATDMLQSIDPQGRILVVNKAWRETLGYTEEEVTGRRILDLLHPDEVDRCRKSFENILRDGREFTCQTVFISKSGQEISVEGKVNCRFVDGKPMALRSVFRNITEKLKMEEELRRAQKLESVGLLAGGIAHDFNNLLTGILGNILLAQLQAPEGDLAKLLKNTENAAHRAQELTRQLLTFSKGGAPVKETASVVDIINEVAPFTLSGSNTNWSLEVEGEISPVDVDSGQISQVLENLIINSDQAMPDGGTIHINISNYIQDEHLPELLTGGKYVKIAIKDQGVGIAREYLPRIFDPYFTTKKRGSGLGLATAYSIIRNHNGLITVDSEPGRGTTMEIYLPVSTGKLERKKTVTPEAIKGSGRILLMDDDEVVRQVGVQMLNLLGYDVVESCDGEDALQKYEAALGDASRFDAVILDLTIPGKMGGKETIARLQAIDPQVKAIVSSGYSNDPIMAEFTSYGFSGVVPKPYSLEKLGSTVHSLLFNTDNR
ncbi:MAG: PAS domain S-box protein [Desulfobulbaceae bacterium]|nr:PAS domain S-box protein [Desulfobulbaceae bacterium]